MVSTSDIYITAILAMLACSSLTSVIAVECSHRYHVASSVGSTEGAFIRGMMAADHQFGLYMSASESARGIEDRALSSSTKELSRRGVIGEDNNLNAVDRARGVAVDFATTVRRRAFFK